MNTATNNEAAILAAESALVTARAALDAARAASREAHKAEAIAPRGATAFAASKVVSAAMRLADVCVSAMVQAERTLDAERAKRRGRF